MKKRILACLAAAMLITGCGAGASGEEVSVWRNDVSAETLGNAVSDELGDDNWANTELAPELLDDWYGISSEMYEEYYGKIAADSDHADTLIIVKAETERLEDVQNAFDTYREAMLQDPAQNTSNASKIQASVIRTYGNYVCYVQLGGSLDEAENEEEASALCSERNEQALTAIEQELTR